ncbi:hypothetical protein [Actinomadura terrae]|uniref:hypothetical protein n=1 Tax=Actinomadura terrae TaxID=604353 RepID=UPI001FA81770|nr:hypothetical protein [Actinomadura terrae]
METEVSPRNHVPSFVRDLVEVRHLLVAEFPGITSIGDLVFFAQGRKMPRKGSFSAGGEYSVHGVACCSCFPPDMKST